MSYSGMYFVTKNYGTSEAVGQTLTLPHAHPLPSASAHAAAPLAAASPAPSGSNFAASA